MLPHLRELLNQDQLENGTYEQIVATLEKELELNVLEALDRLQTNIVSQHATNTNAEKSKPTCHRTSLKILKMIPETKTVAPITLSQTIIQ